MNELTARFLQKMQLNWLPPPYAADEDGYLGVSSIPYLGVEPASDRSQNRKP